MAARPKVALLPDEVRRQLEQKLIANGFGDYEALSAWLASMGFEIAKSSIQRWGKPFQDRLEAIKTSAEQAHAINEASPDNAGDVTDSLIRLAQEGLFNVLMILNEKPDAQTLGKITRAIADLSRASISQKKLAAEVRKSAREELIAEQNKRLDAVGVEKGMDDAELDFWRKKILGLG